MAAPRVFQGQGSKMESENTDSRMAFDQSFQFKGGNKARVRGRRTMKAHVIFQFSVGEIASVSLETSPDEAKMLGNALIEAAQKAEG